MTSRENGHLQVTSAMKSKYINVKKGLKGVFQNKYFNLLKPFNHLNLRLGTKSKATQFAIHTFVFVFFFLIVHFLRTYHFASGYGWLDPWIQVGYGQAFPDTAYVHQYYKESRILSISLEAFFLQFSPYIINFFWEILAALTALVVFRISQMSKNNVPTSLSLGALITLSPILWGDWAGGGDYYNTFGNLIAVFVAMQTFFTSRLLLTGNSSKTIHRKFVTLGMLFAIVALETPSGIIILAPLEVILIFSVLYSVNSSRKKVFKSLKTLFFYQLFGLFFLLMSEAFYLLLLRESPTRLLEGPKFLFDSITNSSIQNAWAQDLSFQDFINLPNLSFFATLLVLQVAFVIFFLLYQPRKNLHSSELVLCLIPVLYYVFLLILQFSNKTIVFTTSYFLTPVLITGICFVANARINVSKKFILLLSLPAFYSLRYFSPIYVLLILLGILFLCLVWENLKFLSLIGASFRLGLSKILLPVMLMVVILSNLSFGRPSDFQICESARIDARTKVIEVAGALDAIGFQRGTLLMGADLDILRKTLKSECSDFNGKPLGGFLIAVAETGFPAASSLGSIVIESDVNESDFAEENLALIANREIKSSSCYVNWKILNGTSQIKLSFMNVDFGASIECPDNL